jgi:hypothetical protein
MRAFVIAAIFGVCSLSVIAQPSPRRGRVMPPMPKSMQAVTAESAIKQAMDQLASEKKVFDRDVDVLRHLRASDEALNDPMQPHIAIQKAYEEVAAAKALNPELLVMQGVIKAERELEAARLSPASTDFGRLRGIVRDEAIGPAARLVARNGARLQEETLSWIRVQELISSHLRAVAEISAESLRAALQ